MSSSSSSSSSINTSGSSGSGSGSGPDLIVFDLDMCLWSPEMYTLDAVPSSDAVVIGRLLDHHDHHGDDDATTHGVVGVKSGDEVVRLFPDALKVLQRYWNNEYGSNVRIAAASSADTPFAVKIARASMSLLEIVPGVTMRQVFSKGFPADFEGNVQIGRTPPLSR